MIIIPDTSIWVEFFRAKDPIFTTLADLMARGSILGLPWVFGELLQGARSSGEISVLLRTWNAVPKPQPRSAELAWIKAGEQSYQGKWFAKGVGLIDAAIVSVAEEYKAPVWTLDKKLAGVLRFKKLLWELRS